MKTGKEAVRLASMFNWSNSARTYRKVDPLHFVQIPQRSSDLLKFNLSPQRLHYPVSNNAVLATSGGGKSNTLSVTTRKSKSDRFTILIGAMLLGSFTLFYFENTNPVFYTKRQRLMGMTWENELAMFNSVDDEEKKYPVVDDEFSQEVEHIARRIVQACEQDFIEVRGKLPWKIRTRLSPIVNAFNAPGGNLTLYTGLIDLCCEAELAGQLEDARNGLACILAHEIAHGYCRHGVEKLSWLPIQTLYAFFSRESPILDYFFRYIVCLPHSRLCETEADMVGLDLMARAGYDPREGLKMWDLLDNQSSRAFEFLSTHPSGGTRRRDWEKALPQAMQLYEQHAKRKFDLPRANTAGSLSKSLQSFWNKYTLKQVNGKPSLAELWKRKDEYNIKTDSSNAAQEATVLFPRPQLQLFTATTDDHEHYKRVRKENEEEDESIA